MELKKKFQIFSLLLLCFKKLNHIFIILKSPQNEKSQQFCEKYNNAITLF
jgi:hypothetical protein